MSFSSFLLKPIKTANSSKGEKAALDKDLDTLFRSSVSLPHRNGGPIPGPSNDADKKRKLSSDAKGPNSMSKKPKSVSVQDTSEDSKTHHLPTRKVRRPSSSRTASKSRPRNTADEETDDGNLEDNYLAGQTKTAEAEGEEEEAAGEGGSIVGDSDIEDDPSQLVHESVSKKSVTKVRAKKVKYVPSDETPEQRNSRTIFVGNVAIEVAKSKSALKQLRRFILSHVPSAKIESTRLRSVAFKNPVSKLTDDGDASSSAKARPSTESAGRTHDRDRASSWRASNISSEEKEREKEKKRLTSQEKKRVAFIKHEIHDVADSVNAYVVFAHTPSTEVPSKAPASEALGPYEAARLAVERCNGLVFMERTLRVDRVGRTTDATGNKGATSLGDPKKTVFVGNLDFASKEEDLRVFFEGVISAERGPRGLSGEKQEVSEEEDEVDEGDKVDSTKPNTWVISVRIVKDKDTQLGKGFAYVQFADRECVDEILALEEGKLKFAKRKLRVQRCKTLPGGKAPAAKVSSFSKTSKPTRAYGASTSAPVSIPKGDPTLGQRVAHLSKESRKQVKATDVDRVARRLAKKKARNALAKAGVREHKKDRERVRKGTKDKLGDATSKTQKKGRVRSELSVAKRNRKK